MAALRRESPAPSSGISGVVDCIAEMLQARLRRACTLPEVAAEAIFQATTLPDYAEQGRLLGSAPATEDGTTPVVAALRGAVKQM